MSIDCLNFNKRWRKDYFLPIKVENQSFLTNANNNKEEKKNSTEERKEKDETVQRKVQNPKVVRARGRPIENREKHPIEKNTKSKRKQSRSKSKKALSEAIEISKGSNKKKKKSVLQGDVGELKKKKREALVRNK